MYQSQRMTKKKHSVTLSPPKADRSVKLKRNRGFLVVSPPEADRGVGGVEV
ncbi:MAG: hypothetical protein HY800_10235 [Ignavibacteriales bacterium]|nr:hypothetical protein [Ignavibacteriales bacterium]